MIREVAALIAATSELLEALLRLTRLSERLLESATRTSFTPEQALQARREIESTREGIEQIDAMLTLRRQRLRLM
jgi:hypothetical protein